MHFKFLLFKSDILRGMDSDIPIFQHQQTVFSRPLQNRAKVNYFCTCETLQKLNGRTLQLESLAKLAKIRFAKLAKLDLRYCA